MTRNVAAFLSTVGDQSDAIDGSVSVKAVPAAGLVKATDGPDWVVGCVLLDIRATIVTTARIGFGHCERMVWHHDRWMIAPGAPPATAPSVWPGSDLAIEAGYQTWTPTGDRDG